MKKKAVLWGLFRYWLQTLLFIDTQLLSHSCISYAVILLMLLEALCWRSCKISDCLFIYWFLCRSQHDEKMTQFFSHNFREDRWRKAALKNAFSLLGKQRFEQSAAFFLLAGSLKDAIEVCIILFRNSLSGNRVLLIS